ncbi:MAG: hypothetical protein JWO95_2520 [Verrucomicrobiales bacterium]|nr:hypothetical protein [Verrucomicrobiales bacterium]
MHGLLLLIVVASSAFQGQPPKQDTTIVNFIPSIILDRAEAGGGTPAPAVTPAPAAATPAPAAAPAQPKAIEQPKPEPVKPTKPEVVKPEPVPEKPKPVKRPEPEPDLSDFQPIESAHPKVLIPKKSPKKLKSADEINVDISHTTSLKSQRKQQQAKQAAQDAADEQAAAIAYNNSVKRALGKIGSEVVRGIGDKTSGLTVIGKVGQGGGGESFGGYEGVVGGIYHRAWVPPDGVSDSTSDTEVEIVVARNGTIISARITSGSTRAMDKSVQAALNKVRKLPPFPEGATDSQRTFQIVFNLKAKLSAG